MSDWWTPELTDDKWLAQTRENYPGNAGESDEWLRDYYANGRKYAVTWDHLGDAYEEYEKLADAYFALLAATEPKP